MVIKFSSKQRKAYLHHVFCGPSISCPTRRFKFRLKATLHAHTDAYNGQCLIDPNIVIVLLRPEQQTPAWFGKVQLV